MKGFQYYLKFIKKLLKEWGAMVFKSWYSLIKIEICIHVKGEDFKELYLSDHRNIFSIMK